MQFKHVLITGGAGFVGANLAIAFKRHSDGLVVTYFDHLSRRGSELNLPRLKRHSIDFVHADIRCAEDVAGWRPWHSVWATVEEICEWMRERREALASVLP
jgi:nucleoside-diphosphate-sugar epimerase